MTRSRARAGALLLASLFVVGACGAGATATTPPTNAPTTPPTAAPTAAPTTPPGASPSDSGSTGDQGRFADWTFLQPCDLLGEEAVTTVIGSLSGEPVRGEVTGGGKSCTWTDVGGGTVTIATADPETFGALRAAAAGAQDVPGLGSGAYFVPAGEGGQLVVHVGSVVVVVDASKGRDVAESAAAAVLAVLEVL